MFSCEFCDIFKNIISENVIIKTNLFGFFIISYSDVEWVVKLILNQKIC